MMYAVLSLGLALLGGIVRLAQVLRLSAPLLYGALVITCLLYTSDAADE